MTIIVADGHNATPLGKVHNVPVKFGGVTIAITMIVVETDSYDVVLGNDFLKQVNAIVDFNAEKMRIKYRGRRFEVPLNINKGVRPAMKQESDSENEEVHVAQVEKDSTLGYITDNEENEWETYGYRMLTKKERNTLVNRN